MTIIGVRMDNTADMTNNSGHHIFVPLDGRAMLNLAAGDFPVLDANGTDRTAAFRLLVLATEIDRVSDYSVLARALGTPDGSSPTTACATDPATGDEVCSMISMVLVRDTGKSTFTTVTRELLYVAVDRDGDGDLEFVPLFHDALEDYLWDYDDNGLRIAQVRF